MKKGKMERTGERIKDRKRKRETEI